MTVLDANSWRRESLRDPMEPHAWEIPSDLYRASRSWPPDPVLWTGALGPLLGNRRYPDHRGVLLASQARMITKSAYVLDWGRDALGLTDSDGWEHGPPDFLPQLIKSFYANGAGDTVALVHVESCRDFLRRRLARLSEAPTQTRPMRFWSPLTFQDKKRVILRSRTVLPPRSLRWEVPGDRLLSETTVTEIPMIRKVYRGSVPILTNMTSWCLATRVEDDALLQRAAIPAGLQCRVTDSVNGARLMKFLKIDLRTNQTESYTIDVNPQTGGVISLRYMRSELRVLATLDPWFDDWVRAAAKR